MVNSVLNPRGSVRLHNVGWTHWLCCCCCCCCLVCSSSTLPHCGLPLDSAWTSHIAVCFLSVDSLWFLLPSFPYFLALLLKSRPPSFSNPRCFTTSLISFSRSLSLLSVLLISPFLPLPLLHPSPHSHSDVIPLCRESRGCRFTEPQRKVWDHTLHRSFQAFIDAALFRNTTGWVLNQSLEIL